MSGGDQGVPDQESDGGDDEYGGEDPPPTCPICKWPATDGPCEHVVALVGHDQIDLPTCQAGHEDRLSQALADLASALTAKLSANKLSLLVRALRLPPRAAAVLARHFADEFTSVYDYFLDIVGEVPGLAGTADCFGDGGGTSSSWHTSWAKDPKKAGRWLDKEVSRDVRALDALRRAAKRSPRGDRDG